jgi:hypothetical protein
MGGKATQGFYQLNNAYFDGTSWKRRTANPAMEVTQNAGNMQIYVAPTGLIDSTITWTEALTINNAGAVVLNEAGADRDFRVEGDTDANLIFADASVDRLGVGTSSPQGKLHVHDGTTGKLVVTKSGVTNTSQVIIPNATGDVIRLVTGTIILHDGTSTVTSTFTLTQGGTLTFDVASGGSTWRTTLNANGELSVARTAGSGTATISYDLLWQ